MRRLLCTALLLLCCAYGCIAAVVQPLPQKGQGPWDTYTLSVPDHDSGKDNFQPIRFAVSAKEIDRVLKYCDEYDYKEAAEKEFDEEYGFTLSIREHREDFCEEPKTKMTDVKKKTLLRDVLPAALKLHSERLNVDPVKDMLKLPFKEEYPYLPNCTNASIPKDHRKKGISNADFMLYVGLTEKYVPVQICSKNEKDRPTSALIKFVPEEIDDTRHFIRFAAHEVAHALGFDIETIKNYINVTVEEKETGKKIVRLVKAPIVLDKMKGHYGCSDDDKCDEVIKKVAFENEPGKDAPLHWERRIAKDELMSTYSPDLDVTGAYYTALTLAVFHSMPFYRANFEMAENMSWGKVAGCDFLEGKDKDIIITERPIPEKYSEMFCNEMEAVLECTSDRFALGRCTKLNGIEAAKKYSPVYLQFSPETDTTDSKNDLTDGYPIIKPIHMTSCENGNVEYMPGSVVGNMSRCLKGKDLELKEENEYGLTVRGICAYVNCEDGKVKVKYSGTDNWHVCNNDNSVITPEGGSAFRGGSILCPKYAEVCTELNSTIDFRITYDEDEKRLMEEEDKQEAEEEKQRIMAQEESEGEALQQKNEQEEAKSREGKLASQTQPQPSIPALAVGQRGLAVAGNANGASHVPTTPSNAGNQRGSPIGVSEKEVVQPSSAASEQHIERREKQAHESKTNNNGDHSQRQPSISAPNVPSDTKRPEMEKNSSEPAKAQDKEVSISEISKPAASESVVVSGHTPSVEEDHNNTTENIEQVQGISTQSPSQNGNDEGINTTVDTTHSPNRPATDNEKEETIVNTDNNTTNTTTSSIPENVNASVAPATLTGPNKTQMGQVINQATAIVIAGADSSIATSYQIPLLLIVSALVALASP